MHLQFQFFCLLAAADAVLAVFEGAAAFQRTPALAQIARGDGRKKAGHLWGKCIELDHEDHQDLNDNGQFDVCGSFHLVCRDRLVTSLIRNRCR